MAYNQLNKLLYYQKVIDIFSKHYHAGITTYKGIWREYVNPIYPMSYDTFLTILGMPNIKVQIAEEKEKLEKKDADTTENQLNLFEE